MNSSLSFVRVSVFLVSAGLASAAVAQTPPSYTVEFLGVATSATGMNDSGVSIGWTTSGSNLRGWVAGNGSGVTLLPLPPNRASSMVSDINDLGMIVGRVATGNSPEFSGVAAVWTPISGGGYFVQEFGALPGSVVSNAIAINNVGDIVGYSTVGSFHKPSRFVAPGVVEDLSASGISDPSSINDLRVLVDATGKRLDLNTMIVQNLGVPTGFPNNYVAVYTSAINASNQVVGSAVLATSTSCDRQAARFTDGIGWQIFSTCGPYNGAHGINDSGDVVMRIATAPYVRFEGIGTYPIQNLIVSTGGPWAPWNHFGSVYINNDRQIVLPAQNLATGQSGMVLLSPIDPPSSYCTAKVNSLGCLPAIGFSGSPSFSGPDNFFVKCTSTISNTNGLLFWGLGPDSSPFFNGTLCVATPLVRTPVQNSGGNPPPADCSGAYSFHFTNAYASSQGLAAGVSAYCQYWGRDPAHPDGTNVTISNALVFTFAP